MIQQRNKKVQDIVTGMDLTKIEPIIPATPAQGTQFHYTRLNAAVTKCEDVAAPVTINLMDTIEVQ